MKYALVLMLTFFVFLLSGCTAGNFGAGHSAAQSDINDSGFTDKAYPDSLTSIINKLDKENAPQTKQADDSLSEAKTEAKNRFFKWVEEADALQGQQADNTLSEELTDAQNKFIEWVKAAALQS